MEQLSKKLEVPVCADYLTEDRNDIRCSRCGKPPGAHVIKSKEQTSASPINQKWGCSICTFENPAAQTKCEICGTRKPTPEKSVVASPAPTKSTPKKQAVASASAPTKPISAPTKPISAPTKPISAPMQYVADEWVCDHCTFRNTKKKDKCEICEVKNPMFIQEEKQCSNCTLYNPKSIKKCLGCGENNFGKILDEPTWICFGIDCGKSNINNPLPRCVFCNRSRAEKIGNIGFFKQDTAMGCMRQAINNIEQKFAVVNFGSFEEKNLQEEISPLNIKAFCDIISAKIDSQTELKGEIICNKYENYEYNFFNKILLYLRYELEKMYGDVDTVEKKIKDFDENTFNERSALFINLGEKMTQGSLAGTNGRHWVSARYIEGKWYYFDGKAQAPKIFNTKNELVNYLKTSPDFTVNHRPINILIYKKLDRFIPNNPAITTPEKLLFTGGSRYNHNKQLYKLLKNMI